jgi:hypothetical protein
MPKIQFSHAYFKLMGDDGEPITKATLLQVVPVEQDKLTPCFLKYDTAHTQGNYAIKYNTVHIILLFLKPNGELFTTIRPQYTQFGNTQKYYEGLCGQEFDIIIKP